MSNLIDPIATLVAAFAGAWFAFMFERRHKRNEEDERRTAAGNRALYTLFNLWNVQAQIKQEVIDPHRSRSDAWLNMAASFPSHYGLTSFEAGELGELDELKMLHRNPEVREKAQKVITRIKGWRAQGPLLEGVLVDKTIQVRAIHDEPNVANSLSWLDPSNKDDRIIATTLHIQSRAPSARIVLVTGDINLQNKSDAASVSPPSGHHDDVMMSRLAQTFFQDGSAGEVLVGRSGCAASFQA